MPVEYIQYYVQPIPQEGLVAADKIESGLEFWKEKLRGVHVMGIVGYKHYVWGYVQSIEWDPEYEEYSATVLGEETHQTFTYPARLLRVNAVRPKA